MDRKQQFHHLSSLVAGFDDLPVLIHDKYFEKLIKADGYKDHLPELLELSATCATTEQLICKADTYQIACCKGIAFLWYAAELISWASANSKDLDKNRLHATEDEYYNGLIWLAIRAHPPGLSGGYYGYWKYEPEN